MYNDFTDNEGTGYNSGASHPNPMFDYFTSMVPRKLKDLFKWSEYLAFNSAHIYAVVRKFGEYPITKFVYDTSNLIEKQRHKELFEAILNMKGFLTKVSFDKWIYGNVFVSLYEPIKRKLICKSCNVDEDIKTAQYTFDLDKGIFKFKCRSCGQRSVGEPVDEKLMDKTKLTLIRWDPKRINIEHNPITGESAYFYEIPREMIQEVRRGNKTMINLMPMDMLKAMQKKKIFRFADGQIFHLKVPGPAGVEAHWGFPPITAAIKLFLFAATLRKANEAIALEHITPFRLIHPQASSNAGDPLTTINLEEWRRNFEHNYKKFRRDPLRIMFAPTPVGVQNVGGEGRALLTLGELQEAEKNIVLSLGVPMEFLQGGLGQTRGDVTLRMIENQLQTHIEDLNGLLQWVEKKCSTFLGWESVNMKLADFKMIDDTENKQLYFQMWQAGKLDDAKMYEMMNVDPEQVRKQRKQEALDQARDDMETQAALHKLQNSLSNQAQQQAMTAQNNAQYDQQAILAQADQIVQQMAQLDAGTRRSQMDALQGEDAIMYAVVKDRLEQMQQNENAESKAQSKQGG